jgi:GNAT superfamily N-acetyltransferase
LTLLQLRVTPARVEDLDTVLEILDEAAAWIIDRKLPFVWKPGEFSRQAFVDQIPRGEVLIGRIEGRPAGTFILQWSDPFWWGERPPNAGYIHKLAVRTAYKGRGVGTEMLRWAEAKARSEGKKFLRLNCIAEDKGIRDYYEKAGFTYLKDVPGPKALASLYEKAL